MARCYPGDAGGPAATPTHADLLAMECGVAPSCPEELPALVLRTADLTAQLFECKGRAALDALVRGGGGGGGGGGEGQRGGHENELQARLRELAETAPEKRAKLHGAVRTSWWAARAEVKRARAAAAAAWVRKRRYKLLLIEPEGVLKRQCCKSVVPSADAALAKRRKSLFGAAKFDAFLPRCVRFLRALLLHLPAGDGGGDGGGEQGGDAGGGADGDGEDAPDKYEPEGLYGDGPPRGVLRADAPRIALVTNLGQLASRSRPGEEAERLWSRAEVDATLGALTERLASELGVAVDELRARVLLVPSPYVSYRAEGDTRAAPPPALAAAFAEAAAAAATTRAAAIASDSADTTVAPAAAVATAHPGQVAPAAEHDAEGARRALLAREWSAEWCKPRPGMLLAAMADAGVAPHEALMVGFDYADREAAHAAETNHISHDFLLFGFDHDRVGDHLTIPGEEQKATSAPGNFAAQRKRKAQYEKGSPGGRGDVVM